MDRFNTRTWCFRERFGLNQPFMLILPSCPSFIHGSREVLIPAFRGGVLRRNTRRWRLGTWMSQLVTTCLDLQTILVGDPLPSASIPRGFIQFPGSSFFLFGSSGVDKDWLWVDVFGAARGRERTSHAPICGSILYRDMSIDKREVSRRASSFLDMAAEFLLLQLPFCEGK